MWIVNDTATDYDGKGVSITGWDVPNGYAGASYQQWTKNASGDVSYKSNGVGRADTTYNVVRFTVPAYSITIARMDGTINP